MKVQGLTKSIVVVVVLALLVGLMALTASGARDCQGKVGSSSYDLAPLERELRGQDVTAVSYVGYTYYYSVCGVVSPVVCQTATDLFPAVCQRDTVGQYHDCGSRSTARFEQLPGGRESDGFRLTFSGGQDGRVSHILFKCDPNAFGSFSFVAEDPLLTYTLEYVSKYACPTSPKPSSPATVTAITLCRCGAKTSCRDCADYPLGQCVAVRPMCSGDSTGFVRVEQQSSTQFLITAFADGACSLPLAQAVTSCGQCNGAVLAQCGSSHGLPWWGILLIVACTLLAALVLALGVAVAFLLYIRHRSRSPPVVSPLEARLHVQVQEVEPLVVDDAVKQ